MRLNEIKDDGPIYWQDPDFDPNNPTIAIKGGAGTYKYKTLKDMVARELADLSKEVSERSGEHAASLLNHVAGNTKSTVLNHIHTFIDATKQIENRHVKGILTRMKKNHLFTTIKNSDQ